MACGRDASVEVGSARARAVVRLMLQGRAYVGVAAKVGRRYTTPGRLQAGVGVQAAEPERAGVRHEHHPEPDDQQERRRPAGP